MTVESPPTLTLISFRYAGRQSSLAFQFGLRTSVSFLPGLYPMPWILPVLGSDWIMYGPTATR